MHHTDQQICACMALRKASRAVTRLYDHCITPKGLTTTQYAILGTLLREGDLPLSDLADRLGMDRTSLYRTIAPVERAGWVSIALGHGRTKIARLTDSGREARAGAKGQWAAAQEQVLGGVPSEEWDALLRTLNRLVEASGA